MAESDKKAWERMSQIAAEYRDEDGWANQPRAVWSGEAMERELDELFPVHVGLAALMERAESRGDEEAVQRIEEQLQNLKTELLSRGSQKVAEEVEAILADRRSNS